MSSLHVSIKQTEHKFSPSSSKGSPAVLKGDPDLLDQKEAAESEQYLSLPPVTLAVIGAGQRGKRYASYALVNPKLCQVVTVAEPRQKTRELFAQAHAIPKSNVFASCEDLLTASQKIFEETGRRLADAVIVAVHDKMHAEVVLKCVGQGFDILCEKPMATSPEDCILMVDALAKSGGIFGMGHVLRYSPYNQSIVKILRSGSLGQLINVIQVEPVGHQHFAHSYVRGNWSKEQDSSFSLMTKSCHDMDIVCHYLYPATPKRVSSFGSLSHFKKSAKPPNAGDTTRCLDCPIERECPYSAKRIYLDPVSNGYLGWPASAITDGPPDIESMSHALLTGPYGQCVYESPNDVADHQVVNMEFSTGATCSFTMVAFSTLVCDRQTRMHFSHGEIVGDMYTLTITNFTFPPGHPQRTTQIKPKVEDGGHGGGDLGLIRAFVKAVRDRDQSVLGTDVMEILRSHLVVFAAEKSRKDGTVVDIETYEKEVRAKMESLRGEGEPV